jgi:hypothetical protein
MAPGYPARKLPKDGAAEATLRARTLTELYNQRPQWLLDAHRELDSAVAAAYGWTLDISDEDALKSLLALNRSRPAITERPKKVLPPSPEEARRAPQFKLPIAGGKHVQSGIQRVGPDKPATIIKRPTGRKSA